MMDVSPDGRRLVQTAGNGEGAVWDLDPGVVGRAGLRDANRVLTDDEWKEFLPGQPYKPACKT